ncbi:Twin-arginine translocation protein TatA [Anopheles sinensis]|uniref:Twin-arginine translocation protein TatA n=1 Tax=Anopheles sinensis TaxID=74873 RepID=A0A084W668_ANOSI|nr:Twin-arginine translocation protein TatA [Anopheles sinensis]
MGSQRFYHSSIIIIIIAIFFFFGGGYSQEMKFLLFRQHKLLKHIPIFGDESSCEYGRPLFTSQTSCPSHHRSATCQQADFASGTSGLR